MDNTPVYARKRDQSTGKRMFLRPAAFADAIDASLRKVYDMVQRNEVPHCLIGGMIRIPVDALDQFTKQAMANRATGSEVASECEERE